ANFREPPKAEVGRFRRGGARGA
ncbi:MAG: hypothetical protein AVDCRST_MAG93-6302, partial [uncultured Chloroflexia bacterium]